MQSGLAEREPLTIWLAASLVAAGASASSLVIGVGGSGIQWTVLVISTTALVTATSLVWIRSRRNELDALREERSRPAAGELALSSAETSPSTGAALPPYASGMLRYSAAVVELLEHAVAVSLEQGADTTQLAAARDDAAALHDLLADMEAEPARLDRAAKVHTICMLWEASAEQSEQLAAAVDPDYHRHWRARHVAAIRMRRGEQPARARAALPYLA